ncbi:localization factor PodJL [Roseiarcus fermentans]|uniref:Localization factor PodJL n=1 Tax=Roseiarcus fermentans TaxID=1473586 RepID=A0A366FPD0_9HYPH|nr:SEL1-like repeat protein [Roseiarcus fermentans]RBP16564.1 localization factor PodJL [Roseiarcus fermentans]
MSRSTAWDIASVSPGARSLAERAASRAGVSIEQWLDQAIVVHAADPDAPPARVGPAMAERPVATDETPARAVQPPSYGAESARDLQERLRATAGPLTRRAPSPEQGVSEVAAGVATAPGPAQADRPLPPPLRVTPTLAPTAAASPPDPARDGRKPPAFDLQSALSEIASRRRALDAHLAHDGLGQRPPAGAGPAGDDGPTGAAASASSGDLRLGLRDLSGKLDALRREWRGARARDHDVAALEEELAAVRRSLAGLAPAAPGHGLAQSPGWPTRAGAPPRRDDRDEWLLAAVNRIALELRDALDSRRPEAAADLDRRIESLGARIDALAGAVPSGEVVEAIRRQMEEVHDLLIAAARRSLPLDRLDDQISRLVDQVERLAAKPPAFDPAQTEELLALMRRPAATAEVEPALASIDARLEAIAGSLPEDRFAGLQASLTAIEASLAAAERESVPALVRDLAARADAAESRERERPDIAPLLSQVIERLDRIPAASLAAIEQELRAIQAGVDRLGATAPIADETADQLAEAIARRLEGLFAGAAGGGGRLAEIDGRLDLVSVRLDEVDALERAARDVLDKLRRGDEPPASDLADQIAALRRERAAADQRAETLLQGVQEVIDRLVDRLSGAAADRPPIARDRPREPARTPTIRIVDPSALDALDLFDPPRPPVRRDLASDRVANAASARLDGDRLLEPGAAPERASAAGDGVQGQASGGRANAAISAHIAAARRAAQSAVAHPDAKSAASWPNVERNVRHAGRFCAEHKRSLLLAAALAMAIAAAARMMSGHPLLPQWYGKDAPPAPAADALSRPTPPAAPGPRTPPAAIDTAPTGSIGRDRPSLESRRDSGPPIPDLSAALPAGVTPPLRDAVLAGSPAAEYDLAQRLFDGRGLGQDQAAAASWFERAASAGFAPAAFRLGALYQKGVGVQRDPAAAKRWYTAAARAGNARAAHNLGVMEAEPADEKADYAEAAQWFRKAGQMGVRDSQYNLAVLYARGLGVERDLGQAWVWFSLAASQGDAEAARKRDEVAAKMDPAGRAAAADALSRFKVAAPDPAANDVAPISGSGGDPAPAQASGAAPAAP